MTKLEDRFEGDILEVNPLAAYQGVTYNQLIVIKLKDGQILGFFDPVCLAKKEHVGLKMKVTADLFPGIGKKTSKKEYAIRRVGNMHAEITGRVKRIWEERDESTTHLLGLVDCGAAIFHFSPSPEIKIGDYISIKGEGDRVDLQSLDR